MDKLKLQWKIFGFLLGFCFLLLVILWSFQTVFLSDMYKKVRQSEIEKAITLVEKNINNENLDDILYELEITKEIMVRRTEFFAPPNKPEPNRQEHREPETITKDKTFTLENGSKISLTFYAIITPVMLLYQRLKQSFIL
ncbi:MAG: hypothetical protein GX848_08360 [Clostridiales bacterium]|nr:hypothetical protein [Clostridiales bacterium]